jgi:hypothetical protein
MGRHSCAVSCGDLTNDGRSEETDDNDSNGPEFHHVLASSMNADLEIEHQGQLGTDSALNRKSGQRSAWQRRSGESVCDGGCVGEICAYTFEFAWVCCCVGSGL